VDLHFEWDAKKAAANIKKHGVAFDEAATAFGDPLGKIVDDPRHSIGEKRFVLIGRSDQNRLLVIMYTERREAMRLISARDVTREERKNYEEN
jgi:uncharacterized DUF497 family protein